MGRVRPTARSLVVASVVLVGVAAGFVVASRDRPREPAPTADAAPRSDIAAAPDAALPPAAAPTPAAVSAVAPAPAPEDPFAAGERCVNEAMAWIARDGPVLATVSTLVMEADPADDGAVGTGDLRYHLYWSSSRDALRAYFMLRGRDTCVVLVGDQFGRVVDRLTTVRQDPFDWKGAGEAAAAHRRWVRELALALAPRGTGAKFRLGRTISHREAPGGTWFEVERTAPDEPTRTIRFGAEPRRDRPGLRAIAPDRVVVQDGTAGAGGPVEFRFGGWGDGPAAPVPSAYRLPTDLRRLRLSPDGIPTATSRVTVRLLKVNAPIDADLLDLELTRRPPPPR
ncbi:MAG: hypothetical protein JNM10_00135 [Planctomycetia bacterium]|nr:hypothetical protein [Planctomycetia bacterium]